MSARHTSVVLNAVARLIYRSRKFDQVKPLLHDIHWLRIPEIITFLLAVWAYRCRTGLAPQYLADGAPSAGGGGPSHEAVFGGDCGTDRSSHGGFYDW